jgi:hypothetical protein
MSIIGHLIKRQQILSSQRVVVVSAAAVVMVVVVAVVLVITVAVTVINFKNIYKKEVHKKVSHAERLCSQR